MRKLRLTAAAAALATLVAIILPVTGATGAQGGRTLKFSALYGQQTEVDATGDGDMGAGDYFVGNFILRRGGRERGHLEFHCAIVTTSPQRELCHGVAHIDGHGEIVLASVASSSRDSEKVAITGGSGEFGGASGNGKFEFGRARAHMTFTIR